MVVGAWTGGMVGWGEVGGGGGGGGCLQSKMG